MLTVSVSRVNISWARHAQFAPDRALDSEMVSGSRLMSHFKLSSFYCLCLVLSCCSYFTTTILPSYLYEEYTLVVKIWLIKSTGIYNMEIFIKNTEENHWSRLATLLPRINCIGWATLDLFDSLIFRTRISFGGKQKQIEKEKQRNTGFVNK